MSWLRVFPNGFVFSLLLASAVCLGWMNPDDAKSVGDWGNGLASNLILVMIFLIQGWKLDASVLFRIFANPIQLMSTQLGILFFPGLSLFLLWSLGFVSSDWLLSLVLLAFLPTTISSSVVYTREAEGDASHALGNATLSNLLAPFVLFLVWIVFFSKSMECTGSELIYLLKSILPKLLLFTVIPCSIGWLFARRMALGKQNKIFDWAIRNLPLLGIALLAYCATGEVLTSYGHSTCLAFASQLIFPIVFLFALNTLLGGLYLFYSKVETYEKIAIFFCFTQKSMVMGLPLLQLLSEVGDFSQSKWFFPIVLFHFVQLLLGIPIIYGFRKRIIGKFPRI